MNEAVNELKAWIEQILREEISDLCLNGAQRIFVDRGRGMEPVHPPFSVHEECLKMWVLSELSRNGLSWDATEPFADFSLTGGHRVHAIFPPISPALFISIRKHRLGTPARYWAEHPAYGLLSEHFKRGETLIITGATGAGKTTLAAELLGTIPHHERVIALEDTPEIQSEHPHLFSLIARKANADGYGEVGLPLLLKQCLRMRPDRIILGECRGAEVLDLLQVLNTGHRGTLATLHANSARDGLKRIELLCLMASRGGLPVRALRELIAVGIQWMVHVRRMGDRREISEIYRIEGCEGDTILFRPMLT